MPYVRVFRVSRNSFYGLVGQCTRTENPYTIHAVRVVRIATISIPMIWEFKRHCFVIKFSSKHVGSDVVYYM